ncbi:MAG TPA: MarR family transcriptional regulator [Acidimicrobiales bacterium]|nr:MarR family transcriptional regulator [Acidimicrobiales bacterium]
MVQTPALIEQDKAGSAAASEGAAVDADAVARLRLVLLRLARRLRRHAESGITPSQLSVLSSVGAHGPMSLADLAAHEGVQPPSVTRMVSALEEAGLVRRTGSPDDRRTVLVQLSPEGRRALDAVRRRRDAWLAAHLARLEDDERARLEAALPVLERLLEVAG